MAEINNRSLLRRKSPGSLLYPCRRIDDPGSKRGRDRQARVLPGAGTSKFDDGLVINYGVLRRVIRIKSWQSFICISAESASYIFTTIDNLQEFFPASQLHVWYLCPVHLQNNTMARLVLPSAFALLGLGIGARATAPYCLAGDDCFPSTEVLNELNATVGGQLIKIEPYGAPCYAESYDEEACKVLIENKHDLEWRAAMPGTYHSRAA